MRAAVDTYTDNRSFAVARGEGEGDAALAETLVELTREIAQALDCSECCVYDYDPDRDTLRALAIWSRFLEERDLHWVGEVHPVTEMPAFEPLVARREVVTSTRDDVLDTATAAFGSMEHWGERAAMWVPIVHADDLLDILELTQKQSPRAFTEADKTLVRRMSALAALALHNARLMRTSEERNRQLTALIDSCRAMISTLDLDEVLGIVCRQAALALDADGAYIFEYDDADDTMLWLAHHQRDSGRTCEEPLGSVYPVDEHTQDFTVVRTRQPMQIRIDDPDLDPGTREQLAERNEKASLTVPLLIEDRVVGALEVCDSAAPRHFTERESILCMAIGEQAAVAIHKAQLQRRVREHKLEATTDGLTGLANQRCFWERLQEEVTRAKRYVKPLSLLMIDLDDFKRVNDEHGHLAGDQILREVAKILRARVRFGIDVPARYGGEEFAVILPATASSAGERDSVGDAGAVAERIRASIGRLVVAGDPGSVCGTTVSIGVATLPRDAADAQDLVAKADRALYRAKDLGKDRVIVFTPG